MKCARGCRSILALAPAMVLCALASAPLRADLVALSPMKDNSIYEDNGSASNGVGPGLYSGETSSNGARRALLAFCIASSVPPGSTITSVSLRLRCSTSPFTNPAAQSFGLHKLLADWGEAGSDAGDVGGLGAAAQTGDVTWTERFFGLFLPWATPGGVFAATASASASVGVCNPASPLTVTFATTPQLVADVQSWVTSPSNNFGWLLKGNEASLTTAREFGSRENTTSGERPRLTVNFTPGAPAPGAVPNGSSVPGTPLTLAKAPAGQITLSWGPACRSADTYAVYEGPLGTYYNHAPITCSTGGSTSSTFTPASGSTYYLIVPIKTGKEGSYGVDSNGSERPQGGSNCGVQALPNPVCPTCS